MSDIAVALTDQPNLSAHLIGNGGPLCGSDHVSAMTFHPMAGDYHQLRKGFVPPRLRVEGREVTEADFAPLCGWCTLVYSTHAEAIPETVAGDILAMMDRQRAVRS